MALTPGTRLGPYEVVCAIGAGGMGEVYRATDTKLKRQVAIKILPPSVAADRDRLARFQREAEVLASLNHPNIAGIYGLEETAGAHALIMELVEGEDLSTIIARGPVPLSDALPIAKQIAEALDAAHGQGIIHRDLKPANIKLRNDGTVKVLDFGLAKALEPASASSVSAGRAGDFANSPTITSPAMTEVGMILGTAAYMSPEQARGKSMDKRADIWAFGVVLFEMLTGRRLFAGDEVSDTLAYVLTREPDWSLLPAGTAPSITRLLRRCVQKDRSKRLADIADARIEIDEALAAPGSEFGSGVTAAAPQPPAWRRATPWGIAVAAVLLAAAVIGIWAPWRAASPTGPIRVRADLGTTDVLGGAGALDFSPDGTAVAFVAGPPAAGGIGNLLYVRRLSQLDATLIPGTERANTPFFSPDGQWIGFIADHLLKKVSSNGGTVVSIGEHATSSGGAWWGEDDTIVFAAGSGLMRVPAAGGQATLITTVEKGQPWHVFPQLLPGARAVLYTALGSGANSVNSAIFARRLPDGEPKTILPGGQYARYLSSGHLTYLQNGTLFAVPFDVDSLELRGTGVPIIENVAATSLQGGGIVSVSMNGALAFAPGSATEDVPGPLLWLDRSPATHPLRAAPSKWALPRFSPDGRRLALTTSDGGPDDIWVYDWERDILTRLTSDPAIDAGPVWTPDGTRIVFGSTRNGATNLYWQRSDGTGEAHRLTESASPQLPGSIHPNGRLLVFSEGNPFGGQQSLKLLPLEPDETGGFKPATPQTLVGGAFLKAYPMFSPDGRWLAYTANESGQFEIYVQPFPGPGTRVQVSSGGGNRAMWSPTSREIFYAAVGGRERMMAVPYSVVGGTFIPDKPTAWSEARFSGFPPYRYYGPGMDMHPDGKRFVVASPTLPEADTRRQSQLVFIFNFFDELRSRVPLGQ